MNLIVLLLFTFFYNVVGEGVCTEYTTYEFKAITTESYSDNACSDVDDCQLRCAHDSTCTGYLFQELVFLTDKTDDIATSIHGDFPKRKQGDVHAMSNGDFYVTIQGEDPSNSLGDKFYIQFFDSSGNEKGSAIEVYGNSNSRIIQQIRSTVLKNDDIVVIWTESVAPNGNDVYAQRLNSAGVKQGSSFKVNPDGQTGGENYAYISALENGGFIIVWHSGTNLEVKAQRFDASGTKVGSEIPVNAGHTGRQGGNLGQNLVTFSDNTFAIVYNDDSFPSGADSDIVLQLFNADGTKNGNEILVNTGFTGYQFGPSISRFSDNSFVVSWTTTFSGSTGEIHYQRFDASGLKVGPEITVGQQGLFNKGDAYVKVLADDKFMIGYYTDEIGDDANYYNIYVRLFDNSGNQFGTETKVSESDSTGRERYLTITELSNNNIVFVWENYFVVDSTGFKKQEMRIIEVQETNFKKYNYAPHTYNAIADKSYSGNTCSDVDDCKFWCSYDSTCLGYTIPKEIDLAKQVATGERHTCVILNNDNIKCFGIGRGGRLGYGDTNNRGDGPNEMGENLPVVDLGTGKTAKQIVAPYEHTCAILNDDTLKCWGDGYYGRTGYGNDEVIGDGPNEMGDDLPVVNLGTDKTVKQVAASKFNTCVILNDDTVKCWGRGNNGQLGQGDTNDRGDEAGEMGDDLPVINLGTDKTAKQITVGWAHACAILNDDTLKCWGYNAFGQLGYGDIDNRGDEAGEMGDNLPTVDLGNGKTAKEVSAGFYHTCAILNDDTMKCWGTNTAGQLGYGDTNNRGDAADEMGDDLGTVNLGTGKKVKKIVMGFFHACAILTDDTLKCWGNGGSGRLGYGDENNRGDGSNEMGDNLPVINLGTGKIAKFLAAGERHTCAVLNDDTVKCWGKGEKGQLGTGNTNQQNSPVLSCCYILGNFEYGVESGTDGGFVKGAVIPKPFYSTEYNAIADKSYSGNICSDVDDCQLACHDDSTCLGYSPRHFSATTELSEYEYSGNIAKFSDGSIVFPIISSDDKIWIQFYDSTGTIKGTSINIDSTVYSPSQNSFMLTVLTNDDIVIVYNKPMTYRHAIAAKRLNSAGVLQGSEFTVFHDTNPNGKHSSNPRITSLSNGGFIITWIYDYKVKGQIYDASATKQGSVISISDHVFNDAKHHIISFSDNTFLVTYAPSFGSPNSYDVIIQRFNSDGTKNGNEVVASGSDRSYDQRDMDIGVFSDESFVIAWKSINQVASDSSNDVYFQRFDSSGNKVGTETLVNTGRTSGMQSGPKVQTLSDNSFLVSYIDVISNTERVPYVRLFNNLGVQQGDEQKISDLGRNDLLNMIELTNTNVFIVWSRMEEEKLKLRIFKRNLQYGVESGTDGGFVKSTSGFCDANCACFGSCSLSSCVYGCTDIDYKEYSSAVTIGGRSGPFDFTNPCKTCADHAPLTGSECVAYPEYDCDNPATTGTFKLSASCTLSSEVVLTGNLEIIGTVADMDNLITITAATNKRHFKVSDTSHTLTIRHLKLTGGDLANANENGGSILLSDNTLNLYSSEISGNNARHGGGIYAEGTSSGPKDAIVNIYNSIIQNNEATMSGGGMYTGYAVGTIENTKIDNNQASSSEFGDGGGMYTLASDITMKNTIISNNNGGHDGAGLYIAWDSTVTLRQSSFINNDATNLGDEIGTIGSPTISLINTYFNNPNNNNINEHLGTPTWKTCSNNLCTETGFTGACAADGSNSVTCAQNTPPTCPDGKYAPKKGADTGTCLPMPEYDCASPATEGTFKLTTSCTLSDEVGLTGELEIIGQTQDMDNLVTITAATNKRHFKLDDTGEKLTIRHLKLTGGGAGLGNTDTVPGGSILVDPGELNLYSSEISGNKGKEGAGLNAKGDSDNNRNGIMNIYNSIIQNNQATNGRGGGIFVSRAVATIYNTKIDNNQAINDAGGMFIYTSDVTIKNTIISNNAAGPDDGDNGGGLFIYGGSTTVTLRQTSFINNNADDGDELYLSGAPTISLINTYFSNSNNNNNIVEAGGGTTTYATCSDNPCTETGFTGTCAADGTNSVTCPVTTLPACTDSERYIAVGAGMGTCVALLEYDCANPATKGFFKLTNDCTLSSEVELTGELNIRGKYANYWKARTLSFTNVNANHYTVQGKAGEDPTLRLCAGDTYVIERATAGHGLNIKTGDVDQLTAAVTNGSPQSWTPNAGTYKYYCVAHPTTMVGDIIVENCGYTTITAAANKKHFQLDGATHKLTIRNLKLTGGDCSGGGDFKAKSGGSINIYRPGGGEVNVYSSEISGNKAFLGGGIRAAGENKDNRNAILNIYSSIIKNNEATRDGGGIAMVNAVGIIEDSTIDNNEAVRQGGGLRLQADSVTSDEISITNTLISNNKATDKGGGIYIQGGTVFLRQTSINDNTATNDGNEIYFKYVPKVGIVNTDINLDNVFIDNSNMDFVTCANSPCTETGFTGACSADSEKLTCQPTVPCKSSQTINSGKDGVCVGLAVKEMSGPKPTTSADMKTSFTSMKTKFSGTHKIARRQFRSTIKYLRQQIRALTKQRLKIPKTDMVLSTTFSTRMGTRTNVDVIIPKAKTKIDQADACTEADVDLADQTDAYDVSLDEGETSLICHGNTPKTKLKMTVDGELTTPEQDKDTYEYSCWENNAWTVAVEVKSDDYYSCTGGDKYYINSHSGLTCELTPPRNADDTADVGVNNADCGTSLGEGHTCTITCSKCSDVQYTTQQTCTGAGEHWDVRETVSEPSCNADNDPSFTPGVCQCKAGYEDDGTGKCVKCPAGESSTAGGTCEACPANSNSVAGGGCACNLNHRLNLVGGVYVCEACPGANTGRAAGDLISSATVTKCHCIANHKVVSNVCTPCTGSLRDAGDDPDGDDTFCVCDDNFFINDAGTCEACANGAVRTGGDVEGGAATKCLCPVDHVVVSNVCTECGRGKYKPAGDDPSGIDTVCLGRPGMDPGGLADQLGIEEEDLPGDPDSPDGTKYYTRIMYSKDGSLHINKYGFLVDDNGFMLVSKSVDSALHHPKRHHFRRGRHFLQTSLSSQWSIHVPSRYIDITITWDGSVIATTDLGRFHRIGQIKLNSFANPLGLNHYKTVKSRCSTANDFGFALGNWCEGSALDGKPHEYWVETEVSGTGHIGSPGYPGFGILET